MPRACPAAQAHASQHLPGGPGCTPPASLLSRATGRPWAALPGPCHKQPCSGAWIWRRSPGPPGTHGQGWVPTSGLSTACRACMQGMTSNAPAVRPQPGHTPEPQRTHDTGAEERVRPAPAAGPSAGGHTCLAPGAAACPAAAAAAPAPATLPAAHAPAGGRLGQGLVLGAGHCPRGALTGVPGPCEAAPLPRPLERAHPSVPQVQGLADGWQNVRLGLAQGRHVARSLINRSRGAVEEQVRR